MKYPLPVIVSFIIGLALVLFFIIPNIPGPYDDFAKCLNDKGAKMYGTYMCPHCNDQKALFGSSWKHMNYIECSNPGQGQAEICAREGIRLYPTWEFADGEREAGVFTLQELSERMGCPLES